MPIEVQILLPDNLRSSYLRGDFVERGQMYSVDKVSANSSLYDTDTSYNQHDIIIGFKLVDTETREEVALSRIIALRLSNDSEFHASNTVVIENWPQAPATFNTSNNYRRKLNPLFFTGESVDQYRTGWDDDGAEPASDSFTGFFIIEGWPLSATGGLSTIYLQAEVLASGSSQVITYPNDYGLYDQIFWQSERPSAPGKPYAINTSDEYTGKKTSWEFRASEEHASARYNTGVSRYLTDIIELRPVVDNVENAFYSTRAGFDNPGARRYILPDYPAQHTLKYGYEFDGIAFGTGVGLVPAHTEVALSADIHIAAITVEEVDMDLKRPDIAVNASIEFDIQDNPVAATTFYIGIANNEWDTPNIGCAYIVRVDVPDYGATTAQLYRIHNGVKEPNAILTTTLPEQATEQIRLGGTLEMYATDRNDGLALIRAYITPVEINQYTNTMPCESYVIADAIVQSLDEFSYLGGIVGAGANLDCNVWFHELAIASGRFVIGGDYGDCSCHTGVVEFPHVQIDDTNHLWGDRLDSDFSILTHTDTAYGDAVLADNDRLYLRAPSSESNISYSEIQAHIPSFGLRTFVEFESAHYSGDFYIALSQDYAQNGVPSGLRCEYENIESSSPATIMICFKTRDNSIEVRQRLANGALTKRKMRKYTPSETEDAGAETFTEWSIQLSTVPPKGRGNGTWLILRKNGEFWGSHRLDLPLDGNINGTGWYLSAGVRGGLNGDFNDWSEDNNLARGSAVLKSFSMWPEPVVKPLDNNPAPQYRKFTKGKIAQHNSSHLIGQRMVSSITDESDLWIKIPPAPEIYENAQRVAQENISFGSAPDTVDGIPLVANQRILCVNQDNAAENGIYVVNSIGTGSNGIWTRAHDMSTDSQVQYGNRIEVDDAMYARLAYVLTTGDVGVFTGTLNGMPNTVDGFPVRVNDVILVMGDNPSHMNKNGLYTVSTVGTGSNGVWIRSSNADTYSEFPSGTVIIVLNGDTYEGVVFHATTEGNLIINETPYTITQLDESSGSCLGSAWYVDEWSGAFNLDTTEITWKSAMLTQLVTMTGVNKLIHAEDVYLKLAEVLIRPTTNNFRPETSPKIRFYDCTDNESVGNPISQWHTNGVSSGFHTTVGYTMSKNYLIQFDVCSSEITAVEGRQIWMSVMLPSGCEIATGNAKRMGEIELFTNGGLVGGSRIFGLWHKLFLYHSERYNNALNGAYIQTRISADSHARLSSNASLLSDYVLVDRVAPGYYTNDRPVISEVQEPSVRNVLLAINANDEDSGILAFRIIKEGDNGIAQYGPWQNWNHFIAYRTLTTVKAVKTSNHVVLNGSPGTVDGYSNWADGERILLTGQSSSANNGIYLVNLSGSWTRAADFNEDSELHPNIKVSVEEGDTYAGSTWYLHLGEPNETPPYYVMGTTGQTWLNTPSTESTVHYAVYLHGRWPLNSYGDIDTEMLSQNQSMDGARRIWAQVMDAAGNISESEPLTVTAQSLALVDTTAPTGEIAVVDSGTGAVLTTTKEPESTVKLDLRDQITDVKDVRTRMSQAGVNSAWSNWTPYLEYIKNNIDTNVPDDNLLADGLKRIEAQFRDYGNNSNQPEPLWEIISDASNTKKLFTCSCTWTPPGSDKEWLYLGGIEFITYDDYTLTVSNDPEYSNGDAYLVTSNNENDLGRVVYVRDTDDITLTVNSEEWTRFTPFGGEDLCYGAPANAYRVDSERGLIVFCGALPTSPTLNVSVSRKTGVLYRWDGARLELAYDIGGYGEKGILSILPLNDYIALGGYSGNIWGFDGTVVVPSLFTLSENNVNLPVMFLVKFKFQHENSSHIYAGTAIKPRLYRFSGNTLEAVNNLELLGKDGFLTSTEPGSLTCAIGEYNRLFIGTDSNRILQYARENDDTLGDIESNLVETELRSKFLGNNEPYSMPVTCLAAANEQVVAGIGNKPEIWSYSQKKIDQPVTDEMWSTTYFDRWFVNNPAPWQFVATETNQLSGGNTMSSENDPLITWAAITEPNEEIGMRELITLDGPEGRSVIFRTDTGSDWEQACSNAENWMMEFNLMHLQGDGRQSIEIADGRYRVRLDFDDTEMTLTSGDNTITKNYEGWSDDATILTHTGGVVYPERGNKKIWNFAGTTQGNDYGPYWTGDEGDGETEDWLAGDFVIPFTNNAAGNIFAENESDTATFVRKTQSLRVHALLDGDPVIYWKSGNENGIEVDNSVYFYVRMRLNASGLNTNDAKLYMAWSPVSNPEATDFVFSESVDVHADAHFVTYKFSPPWVGTMRSIALQLRGVTQESDDAVVSLDTGGDYTFDIDYISCNTDLGNNNITDNFTPIRIGISNKDVKVWVGRKSTPVINMTDFLGWPTEKSEIIFGKISDTETQSTFGWSQMRFYIGEALPPVLYEVKDFDLMWRFPSSGGVTTLATYQGALWAFTQGYPQYNTFDNPDSRTAHAYSYNRVGEYWKTENPSMPRDATVYGFVNVRTACQYQNSIVVCSDRVNIMEAPE